MRAGLDPESVLFFLESDQDPGKKIMDTDPICLGGLDPDPVNMRPVMMG